MITTTKTATLIFTLCLAFAGAADVRAQDVAQPQPPVSPESEASQEIPTQSATSIEVEAKPIAVESTPALADGEIPALNITWNCGECTQNPKIIPLIVGRYEAEARKNGFTISTTVTANADIVDFHQRNIGLRIAFGFMTGRDRLQLKLKHEGNERLVGDSTGIAGRGQNALCASVGEQLFAIMSGRPSSR